MKKFKVILAAVFCFATLATLRYLPMQKKHTNIFASASTTEQTQTVSADTLKTAFTTAYNEGHYKRESDVKLVKTANGLEEDFVGPIVTQKVTYFSDNWLYMSTNSGYEGDTVERPTSHFKYVNGEKVTDYTIAESQNVSFYTLKSFIDGFNASDWAYDNGTWITTDAENLTMGLGFLAPCFKNTSDTPVALGKVTVTVESNGALTFSLYAANAHTFVTEGNLCIATTTVSAMSAADILAALPTTK